MGWAFAVLGLFMVLGVWLALKWTGTTIYDLLGYVMAGLMLPPAVIGMMGAGVLAQQCFGWLKKGYWEPRYFAEAVKEFNISWPQVKWVGVQRIIDAVLQWVLELPLSLGLIVVGAALALTIMIVAAQFDDLIDKRKRERKPPN